MQEDYLVILEESKTSLNEVSEYALSTVKENILPLQTHKQCINSLFSASAFSVLASSLDPETVHLVVVGTSALS